MGARRWAGEAGIGPVQGQGSYAARPWAVRDEHGRGGGLSCKAAPRSPRGRTRLPRKRIGSRGESPREPLGSVLPRRTRQVDLFLGHLVQLRQVLGRLLDELRGALLAAEAREARPVELVETVALDRLVAHEAGLQGVGLLLLGDQRGVDLRQRGRGVLLEALDAALAAQANEASALHHVERRAHATQLL